MFKLKSISPSRIKTFDMCRFKYWLTYHCPDITLKSNWGAVHGSLIHDILENYSNGNDLDPIGRLYKGYGGVLETLDRYQQPEIMETPLVWAKPADFANKRPYCDTCSYVDTENHRCGISLESLDDLSGCPKDLFNGSVAMVQTTIERYKEIWKNILRDKSDIPVGCEYNFNVNIPGTEVPMIGYMDLVVEKDPETVHVIDYKTGSWTQDYNECRDDIQVRMYSLASRRVFIDDVENRGFNYKNVILTFDYFTKSPITLAFSEEEDNQTEEYVLNKIHEIESTEWITRIVKNNDEFSERRNWKCRSLCDPTICASQWQGKFKTV